MNQKKKGKRRIIHLIVCAALLCGIAGTVLLLRQLHSKANADFAPENVKINAVLTGSPCQNTLRIPEMEFWWMNVKPNYQQICLNDSGYYTVGYPTPESEYRGICYTDAASGQTVYLCAKPECLHDGSDYCPATNADYDIKRIVWYEDMLYAIADKQTHDEENPTAFVLLACQPDGTGMQELAVLDTRGGGQSAELIAHCGAVWVTGTVVWEVFTGDEALGVDASEFFQHYGVWHYEIAKSKLTTLISGKSNNTQSFCNLQADGDDVYVYKICEEKDAFPSGLLRINAHSGVMELLPQNIMRNHYMVTDGKLYWVDRADDASPETREIYMLHRLADGEETVTAVPRGDVYATDGQYLFITKEMSNLLICDMNGDILKSYSFPKEAGDESASTHICAYADGMLYHFYSEGKGYFSEKYQDYVPADITYTESVALADFLSGNADFAPVFETYEMNYYVLDRERSHE